MSGKFFRTWYVGYSCLFIVILFYSNGYEITTECFIDWKIYGDPGGKIVYALILWCFFSLNTLF
jgi:hypothetical protein